MTLTTELFARLKATQAGDNDFGNDEFTPTMEVLLQTTDGTGANQADILWVDERTVADGANDDIDLAGALSGAFGATITAAEVVGFFIANSPRSGAANSTDLTVGNEGTNPWEGFLSSGGTLGPIKPGGFCLMGAGHVDGIGSVTAGTGDILRIANSAGAAATYRIAVVARTA